MYFQLWRCTKLNNFMMIKKVGVYTTEADRCGTLKMMTFAGV